MTINSISQPTTFFRTSFTPNQDLSRVVRVATDALVQITAVCIKLAPAIVAIHMISSIPTAEAGPVAYAACMTACTAATGGAFIPVCAAVCAPTLAAPTP
jgi:hypothetical protein